MEKQIVMDSGNYVLAKGGQKLFLPSFSPWAVADALPPARKDKAPTELLLDRAWTDVLAPCHRQGISGVRPLGFHPLFNHIRLIEAPQSDWLIFPMERDPIYRQGEFPVPRKVLEHLREVDGSGASFDALYIAHELPKDLIKQGDETAVLKAIAPAPPRDVVELSAKLGRISVGTLLGAFSIPWMEVAKAGLSLGAVVATVPLLLLDPVIFGAITPRRPTRVGDPSFFFLLASWEWEVEG
jgi:hypothetical protein